MMAAVPVMRMKIVVYIAAWQMACCALSFSQASNPAWKRAVLDTNEHGSRISRPSNEFASITFLDNERIAVSEEKPTGTLTQRDSLAGSSAFVLTMQVLSATSGATTLSVTWPTRRSESSVQAVAGGLLIRNGSVLRFYDSKLKQASEIPLEENATNKWVVIVSSSRQNIVLRHYSTTLNQFVLIDGSTWKIKKRWDEQPAWRPIQMPYSASDEALARADSNQQSILYSYFGSAKWYPVKPSRMGCFTFPVWINRTSLVNAGCELSLISIGGDVLMRVRPPKHWSFNGKVAASQNGRYIAAQQDTGKGGGFWDTDARWTATRIVVYDLSVKTASFCVDVVPLPRDTYDFALSPDGSKLAVLSDGILTVYRVQVIG
jgi:hypothetical protein